ncbi:6-phosphogluconolactonase [Nanoarchaeota archaeon]
MRSVRTINDESPEALAYKTAAAFFMEIRKLLQTHEKVTVGVCGGTSVQEFYRKIPEHAWMLSANEWKHIHFFWVDERIVPPESEESNYQLVMQLFLRQLVDDEIVLEENIHRYRGEEEPDEEIARYSKEIEEFGGIHVAICGVGPDCHIGALYPGKDELKSQKSNYLHLDDSPKPPPSRATMSPELVKAAAVPFLFFISDKKRDAYEKFTGSDYDFNECPAKLAVLGDESKIAYVITNLI